MYRGSIVNFKNCDIEFSAEIFILRSPKPKKWFKNVSVCKCMLSLCGPKASAKANRPSNFHETFTLGQTKGCIEKFKNNSQKSLSMALAPVGCLERGNTGPTLSGKFWLWTLESGSTVVVSLTKCGREIEDRVVVEDQQRAREWDTTPGNRYYQLIYSGKPELVSLGKMIWKIKAICSSCSIYIHWCY